MSVVLGMGVEVSLSRVSLEGCGRGGGVSTPDWDAGVLCSALISCTLYKPCV